MAPVTDPWFLGQLAVTIFAFTILFDLVDLRPLVGSFAFAGTRTYLVYFLFRLLLAAAASALIIPIQPSPLPVLVGLAAVLGGVILLQGLTLNIAGEDVVDLASLIGRYKQTMVEEAAEHRARILNADILTLTNELLTAVPEVEDLWHELESVLLLLYAGEPGPVLERVGQIREQASGDPELARRTLATLIVQANPEYARRMLRQRLEMKRAISAPDN